MSAEPTTQEQKTSKGVVQVFSGNILAGPLLESADADMIVVRDVSGKPQALLVRQGDDRWAFGSPNEPDWAVCLAQFGVH